MSYCAGITDTDLMYLQSFPGLRQLFLRGCPNITEMGLRHLGTLTELKALELTDCHQLSAAAVAALRKALPKCEVLG